MVDNTQQCSDVRNLLVATDCLEQHLSDGNLGVYDCSVIVKKNTNIEKRLRQAFVNQSVHSEYELEHIPSARFSDIPENSSLPMKVDTDTGVVKI